MSLELVDNDVDFVLPPEIELWLASIDVDVDFTDAAFANNDATCDDDGSDALDVEALVLSTCARPLKRILKQYTMKIKLNVLYHRGIGWSQNKISEKTGITRQTISTWDSKREAIILSGLALTRYRASSGGCRELLSFAQVRSSDLHDDRRRENRVLSVAHMVRFLFQHHRAWYEDYQASHGGTAMASLATLCRQFAYNHGFSQRRASQATLREIEMRAEQAQFTHLFWELYSQWPSDCIVNVDETGVCIDMPPRSILSKTGASAAINKSEKNSCRLTAVLAVKSNGEKLPIMFIMKAKPGSTIEENELNTRLIRSAIPDTTLRLS
ncbi:hypothetical protein ACHHYP_11140 [Achlya hypogyna]|uniref:Uncharacterized protein n=1 Tax=Achlya hypogyna TaxID=1202772 RepID=A0A1V9YJQ8_ACHHY|nr:hypothetical protein ACHHYP_11140 [Achlya hypogyna]